MSTATAYLQVRLSGVCLQRAGRRVLTNVHWRIRPGQRWILLGANGSGKTQLLKLIAGIVRATPSPNPRLHWLLRGEWHTVPLEVRRRIAYLGPERQDKYERYDWNMAAEDVVGTGLYATDIPLDTLTAAERQCVKRLLGRLGIGPLAQRRFLDLSHGQRRMVLLARALISRPGLLLLDEVFTGLDPENHALLARWLARLRGPLPLVIATHALADVPPTATHALVLRDGRVANCGRLGDALRDHSEYMHRSGRAARSPSKARPRRMRQAPPLVRLHQAHVYLDGFHALHSVSLRVHAGEFWVIHGPNGAGKTTLLRTLYGDHGVAAGGTIERAGISPGVALEKFRAHTGIAAPYIHAAYPRNYTVAEVVLSGRHASIGLQRGFRKADRAAAQCVLRRLAIRRWAQRRLAELSYGQTRRVLFARALVRSPRLLLLDEPFDSVDAATRAVLARELRRLASRGVAIVVAAHAVNDWARCATHELELVGGRVQYCGVMRGTVPGGTRLAPYVIVRRSSGSS